MPTSEAPPFGLPEGTSDAIQITVMFLVILASLLHVHLWGPMTFEVHDWVMKRRPEFRTDACYHPLVCIGSFLVAGIFAIPLAICWLYGRFCMSDTTTCCGRRSRFGGRGSTGSTTAAGGHGVAVL
ncbi:hypothetical protein QBC35DRAFT_510785 [Podospora australis]|uniref:Transmembrane protein n=1 Tax=Podospora australis TaxID=1536484 RepID=A0AAN6WKE1_9PEZI|nr:hypothetical protein QBC35DRAFT_510785 [Podospora australis]